DRVRSSGNCNNFYLLCQATIRRSDIIYCCLHYCRFHLFSSRPCATIGSSFNRFCWSDRMRVMPRAAFVIVPMILVFVSTMPRPPAHAQGRAVTVEPMHFHHVHLNSVN